MGYVCLVKMFTCFFLVAGVILFTFLFLLSVIEARLRYAKGHVKLLNDAYMDIYSASSNWDFFCVQRNKSEDPPFFCRGVALQFMFKQY